MRGHNVIRLLCLCAVVSAVGCSSSAPPVELPEVENGVYLTVDEMLALSPADQELYCAKLEDRLNQLSVTRAESATKATELQAQVDSLRQVVLEMNRTFRNLQTEVRQLKLTKKTATHYTVREGDTLTQISSLLYGTGAKWEKIYEANKDILPGPTAALKPGTQLRIPQE